MDPLTLLRDYESDTAVSDTAVETRSGVVVADSGFDERYLAATLPVRALALGAVGAFAAALNRYRTALGLAPTTHALQLDRITASFSGDRLLRIDGNPIDGFAPLSGFFETADGWVRTHANYPHHRRRLLRVLDLSEDGSDASRDTVAARLAEFSAADLEGEAADAGAILVRVRDETEWAASEPGSATASGPLLRLAPRTDSITAARTPTTLWGQPLAGVRVLDLTRVIAGPTATRALALLGAQVLRIDPPQLPEIAAQHTETGQGKRSGLLDVHSDPETARELLRRADVVVTGYRPDALGDLTAQAPQIQPGIVRASVCAWGERGPWAARRGFDSIVQAASGIALLEGRDGRPGALPAQALDHATGYLLAAGIVDGLAGRVADGRGRDVRTALARTAAWLSAAPGRDPEHPKPLLPTEGCVVTHDTDEGIVQTARPALAEYDDYPFPAHPWGSDKAAFAGAD